MSEEKFDLPNQSPVLPAQLKPESKFCFNCYPGISCFNACCKQADITLAPYDIIRLKNRLGMSSTEFLKKHTVPFEIDAHGLPGVKLRTTDDEPVCLLMDEEKGCTVYEDRPAACRYYPMGLLASRKQDEYHDEQHYAIVKEEHCRGHEEERELSVQEYREEQGVIEYDELNRGYLQLILKKKSAGPAIGKPSPTSFQLFFMVCYDTDRFVKFLTSPNFRKVYDISDELYESILADDIERLKFGYDLLKQVLFGEDTVPLHKDAYEKRMEERREILEARRQAEIALHQQKAPFEEYIED
ncbi:MAG TPA: YkgJ family cysteine cluster protein [Gammaproteobacteria bacterium]|nr:YkgJ family cysteine cluster protein [Gammaproteobacteria bacterium]